MTASPLTIRRSELTLGGHSLRMLHRAAESDADEVMADCEDACPLSAKGEPVRRTIVEAFTTLDWGSKFLAVRPNNTRSPFFEADLEYVVTRAVDRFHGVVVPKVFEPEQIERVDELLTRLEARAGWTSRLRIEALIETARGVENAYRIATASDRMASLIFGIADYAADLGIADAVENQHIRFLYAKQRTVNAAKAAGLDAIDCVNLRYRDIGALWDQCRAAAGIGFDGKWAIHPSHIPVINTVFSPTDAQVQQAVKVVRLYEEADRAGHGALADPDTGEMIDEATVKMAFRQILKGHRAGAVDAETLRLARRSAAHTGYDFLGLGLLEPAP
jgi:citrate lyase subunit beta / citryl-CoA lyase